MHQQRRSAQHLHVLVAAVLLLGAPAARAQAPKARPPAAAPEAVAPRPTPEEEAAKARAAARAAERAAAQQALNERVLAREFDAGDLKKIDEEVEANLKKKVKPVEQAPQGWQPGWTCAELWRLRPGDWASYRNCRYYHRYYGRYWR